MGYIQNNVNTVEGVLASAVANSGTLTISYPSGTTQQDFDIGLAGSGAYIVLNENDQYTAAATKMSLTFNTSDITVTNLSGVSWAAGTKYRVNLDRDDGNDLVTIQIPVKLSKVTAADVVTDYRPCIDGTIESVAVLVTDPVTTGSKLATLNLEIGTTDLTGGVLALTSAALTPLGKIVEGTAITANNTLTKASKISVEATSVTAFVEGEVSLMIRVRRTGNI